MGTKYASKTVGGSHSSRSLAGGGDGAATEDIEDSPVDEDALMAGLEKRPQADRNRASVSTATGRNDAGLGERATPAEALNESNLTMNGAFGQPVAKIWYISLARNPLYGHPLVYRDRNKILLTSAAAITGGTIGIGVLAAGGEVLVVGGEWALARLAYLFSDRWLVARATIAAEAALLSQAFGRHLQAQQTLQALKDGTYRLSPYLTTEMVLRYRELILRALADPEKERAGQAVQALRLQIVEQLLPLLRAAGQ